MCAVKEIIFVVFIAFQILSISNGNPLFFNHLTSLLGASSGSSTNPGFEINPNSENIANVPQKSGKLQQINKENTDNSFSFSEETNTPFDFDFATTSEAPSIFQKKLEKIIRKIVTVSQIQQALSGHLRDVNSQFQYPYSPDLNQEDIRFSKQKEYGQPLKIDLVKKTSERKDNIEETTEIQEMKDYKIAPATLGVFIFEVFASLVGLTLGAAAQLNQTFAQNNTV